MAFVEKTAPEQFKFEHVGSKLQGVLLGFQRINVKDRETGTSKPVVQFTVRTGNKKVTFLGTADLVQKIDSEDIGHPIYVEYTGQSSSVEKNGNKMREYKVMVDRETQGDTSEITDADVPF